MQNKSYTHTFTGYICGTPIYEYGGWLFEFGYTGPWPLKKDLELRKRCGDKFMKVWAEWYDLPEEERELYRVGGGCERF